MTEISVTQMGTYISPMFKYKIKPCSHGFILKKYKSNFNKLFNIKAEQYHINNIHSDTFGDDSCLDYESYKNYCEKGFNDNPMNDDMLDLLNAASGVAEEANELMGVVRKFVFHNKPFSVEDFASEAGDLTWFFSNLLRLVNVKFSDVLKANKIKLDFRYPNGRDKNYQLNIRNKGEEKLLIKKLLEKSGTCDKYSK